MRINSTTLVLASLLASVPASAQLTIRLASLPATTPAGATIYVAGTFNNWNPAAPGYALRPAADGALALTLPDSVRGVIEFKFTLGSWETVETDAAGAGVPNRTFTIPRTGASTLTATVARWSSGKQQARASTASRSVTVLSDSFAIPQLGRMRRVMLYLPPDYATSQRRYPVLYMHDAQNVFDAATSFAGEWGVDETLDELHAHGDPGAIVVAIDNGGTHRMDEYNPWKSVDGQHGGGEGDAYVQFLVKTLKPYIDSHYRTRPDRENTGIMGSSMGGLISLYAALQYPEVFGRAGVFSCACWVAGPRILALARHAKPKRPLPRLYFVAGGLETNDGSQARDQQMVIDSLVAAGFPSGTAIRSFVPADGRHSEWFWRREFPAAYQWLFGDSASLAALPHEPVNSAWPLPSWTRGATCYEVFVRSFKDSNGDGIGDINGLISKLDYINDGNPQSTRDLGARCIWLMPVAESPSYHGYDVSDYYTVEKDYGTNQDFKRLIAEAHKRGIRVLVDMVLNHTSSEHPYFQAALHDSSSQYRNWYRFSKTKPTDLNPWGQSNWHKSPVRDEWYYGFFWGGMPDLNYDYKPVRDEAMKIATYWLREMDADGFRLDAIPYLVEEDGKIQHTTGTHTFLHEYAEHVRSVAPESFTVGEVSDSTKYLLGYYPDQLDSHFAFELADSIISAVNGGSAKGLLPPALHLQADVPVGRWSPFLSNHDQTRVATKLGGDRARARVAAVLLMTMPGTPFVYYGEEIGMVGSKPDPRLRTPMQWTSGRGAGFTTGKPWEALQTDSQTTTVAAQERDRSSLLNLYRRLIHLREASSPLAVGALIPLTTSSDAVTAYVRRDGERAVIVIANLGATTLRDVALSAPGASLPGGRWTMRDALGGPPAATLAVPADGAISGYVPLPSLAPMTAHVFTLTARRP
jgi:glycosidase/predicted alpha/beta superfamily hydrolase